MPRQLTRAMLPILLATSAARAAPPSGLPLRGKQAEEFLRTAKVVDLREIDSLTASRPERATLSDGHRTLHAIFKSIDDFRSEAQLANGETITNFRDSYYNEIAAYELDKLLGLNIVPPCVRRRVGADPGAMCLWVEGAMTEWDRSEVRHLAPPDLEGWNRQMHTVRLFLQLTYDFDYLNVRNLLIDEHWKIYKIDSSRSFRTVSKLRDPSQLERFSRRLLQSLRDLDVKRARAALGRYLSKPQINALMARRDQILEVAAQRVDERGEAAVLYP